MTGRPGRHAPQAERDRAAMRRDFTWEAVRRELQGLPGGGLNIAHAAVERHASGARRQHTAIRWIDDQAAPRDYTYAELAGLTSRFANALSDLGITAGDRVFALMGRIPELYITAFGTLKCRGVFCPLFSAFGPEPVHARLLAGNATVLVTTPTLYERSVAPIRHRIPSLKHVVLVGDPCAESVRPPQRDFWRMLNSASDVFEIPPTDPEMLALLHFTSGTSGTPKGALHVHDAVVAHEASARYALDLTPDDVYWCTADPGWVTGTTYGLIAPLVIGATSVVDRQEFDAARWLRILQDHRVNVWYTAPTALRMLMRLGDDAIRRHHFESLRLIASVGEPLDAQTVLWGERAFGTLLHDTWWQTETGAIMIANAPAVPVRPGSMGKPLPGVEAAIVERTDGGVQVLERPDSLGELALRAGWPSMFRGYLDDAERYRRCFGDGWYLSGDLARRDADGYFWFIGRADDAIKSAGHLIGPFEVESTLLGHPAVLDAGVIGIPDPLLNETVKAYVVLRPGYAPDEPLKRDLMAFARVRLGPTVAPREIEFRDRLPKTRSGKVMRRLLKARELGLPTGDLSMLDERLS